MFLALASLYLLHGLINADASPLSVIFSRQNDVGPSFPQDCQCVCPSDTRSTWDIVWSCLVTIFACSWISVHPNIPGVGERWWMKAVRRLELMFWSIISPELIIYWASVQWQGARFLAEKYRSFKWTQTHGYFTQMGGFMLYDGEKAMGALSPEKLEELIEEKRIIVPTISEEEIKDRSKGDGLSKAFVMIQTTWFIAQCIVRRVRGLIITELELVTLAFAALNVVMYAFWWNKPLDVTTTLRVDILQPIPPKSPTLAEPPEGEAVDVEIENSNPRDTPNVRNSISSIPQDSLSKIEPTSPISAERRQQPITKPNFGDFARSTWRIVSGILFRWPVAGTFAIVSRMADILNLDARNDIGEGQMRVNTFYAYEHSPTEITGEDRVLSYFLAFIGMLFGAIHCLGWNFLFPSLAEANIWRTSSAVITGVPVIGLGMIFLRTINYGDNFLVKQSSQVVTYLVAGMVPFYVLARLALLVEALISLRDLPTGAFATVEWTSFIPHV